MPETKKQSRKLPTAQHQQIEKAGGIDKLLAVVAALRHPEYGCPWDLKQSHHSLSPYLLEESYETVEALYHLEQAEQENKNSSDAKKIAYNALCEELGDVLLQVALHGQVAQDAGHFNFHSIAQGIAEKLIRRHPHVFGDGDIKAENADEVTANWAQIKAKEKETKKQEEAGEQSSQTEKPPSVLSGMNKQQPALLQALDTSKKAVAVGFEWPSFDSLWACVLSEHQEFLNEARVETPDLKALEDEFGDILFASVNLARHFKINPEVALIKATRKFTQRFEVMEHILLEENQSELSLAEQMKALDFECWDALWEKAKAAATAST